MKRAFRKTDHPCQSLGLSLLAESELSKLCAGGVVRLVCYHGSSRCGLEAGFVARVPTLMDSPALRGVQHMVWRWRLTIQGGRRAQEDVWNGGGAFLPRCHAVLLSHSLMKNLWTFEFTGCTHVPTKRKRGQQQTTVGSSWDVLVDTEVHWMQVQLSGGRRLL